MEQHPTDGSLYSSASNSKYRGSASGNGSGGRPRPPYPPPGGPYPPSSYYPQQSQPYYPAPYAPQPPGYAAGGGPPRGQQQQPPQQQEQSSPPPHHHHHHHHHHNDNDDDNKDNAEEGDDNPTELKNFHEQHHHHHQHLSESAEAAQFDIDHKGYLTEAEKLVRDMDTHNHGHLSNEKAVQIMEHTMTLQKDNDTLHRWVYALLFVVCLVGCATAASAFAAVNLSKDTQVSDDSGVLQVKSDGNKAVITVSKGSLNFYPIEVPPGTADRPTQSNLLAQNPGVSGRPLGGACIPVRQLNQLYREMALGTPTNVMLEGNVAATTTTATTTTTAAPVTILGLQAEGSTTTDDGVCFNTEQGDSLCYDFGNYCPTQDVTTDDPTNPGGSRQRRRHLTLDSLQEQYGEEFLHKNAHRNLFHAAVFRGIDVDALVDQNEAAAAARENSSFFGDSSSSSSNEEAWVVSMGKWFAGRSSSNGDDLYMGLLKHDHHTTAPRPTTTSNNNNNNNERRYRRLAASQDEVPAELLDFSLSCDDSLQVFGYRLDGSDSVGTNTFFQLQEDVAHLFTATARKTMPIEFVISGRCRDPAATPVCKLQVKDPNFSFFNPFIPSIPLDCQAGGSVQDFKFETSAFIRETINPAEKQINELRVQTDWLEGLRIRQQAQQQAAQAAAQQAAAAAAQAAAQAATGGQ